MAENSNGYRAVGLSQEARDVLARLRVRMITKDQKMYNNSEALVAAARELFERDVTEEEDK
jgi:hypothetical protein